MDGHFFVRIVIETVLIGIFMALGAIHKENTQ